MNNNFKVTEPKRLFDKNLKVRENVIANTGDEKWIVSDLWISNSSNKTRLVTIEVAYQEKIELQSSYREVRRKLFDSLEIQEHQTIVVGNIILEPKEIIYAYSDGDIHAHIKTNMIGENNDLVIVSKNPGVDGNNITIQFKNPQIKNSPLTVDVDGYNIVFNLATDKSTEPVKSTFSTDFPELNNNITFTSKEHGSQSNMIGIEFVNNGANQPLKITINDPKIENVEMYEKVINIQLATDLNSNIVSTATQVINAINSHNVANTLVLAENKKESAGTGFVKVLPKTLLNGGIDANIITTANDIKSLLRDNKELDKLVYIHIATANSGEGIVKQIVKSHLMNGDKDKYFPEVYSITGIDVIGYGRVV